MKPIRQSPSFLNPKQIEQIPGSGENFKESRRDTVGAPVKKKKKGKECESLKVGERQVPLVVALLLPQPWEDPTAQTLSQGSGCGEAVP